MGNAGFMAKFKSQFFSGDDTAGFAGNLYGHGH